MAAYLSFGRRAGDRSARTSRLEPGIVVDFAADDRPIGLEITSPRVVTLDAINRVLTTLGQPLATPQELATLFATQDQKPAEAAR